ncbi:MAG TPA: hypothetical protein VLV54_13680 [Thermoanaerobaculia bacterium]|nr:hypothetical protein [Thermoanaerobaculia bacterium]
MQIAQRIDRTRAFRRLWKSWPLLFVLALNGCNGCRTVDYPVSSPPSDPGGAHRTFAQSETSMVRVDQTADRPEGEPVSRFLVGYNDTTSAIADTNPATCWAFNREHGTTDGWASSDDFGANWTRHDQLPVSAALRGRGINARHGDPWLAAWNSQDPKVPGIVLYVSVAQGGLARFGPPWFLLLTRSLDNGKSFGDSFVLLGPQGQVPDGPKVAIDGDGTLAVVVWNEPGLALPYRLVWNLDGPLATSATVQVNPAAIADPPNPSCTYSGATAHPRVAAGKSTFYVSALVFYSCTTGGSQQRLEVYRNSALGVALGVPWQRILSALPPPSVPGGLGILNAQDAAGTPRFGTRTDRGSSLPDLAVGQGKDGEFVIAADLQVQTGTLPDEATSEKVVLFRVPQADTCDARNHKGDLDSCGLKLTGQTVDSLAKPSDMETISSRAGVWESKPALFTGKVPDGTVDERVGVVWYSQPYKGRMTVTDEMRARTIVEGAVSTDTGLSFSGPFTLTAKNDVKDDPPVDPDIGVYFYPCQLLCTGYFGEYVSGAFQIFAPGTEAIMAAWGDSREGCTDQSSTTKHHHVWAGAVRAK